MRIITLVGTVLFALVSMWLRIRSRVLTGTPQACCSFAPSSGMPSLRGCWCYVMAMSASWVVDSRRTSSLHCHLSVNGLISCRDTWATWTNGKSNQWEIQAMQDEHQLYVQGIERACYNITLCRHEGHRSMCGWPHATATSSRPPAERQP